VGGGFAGTVISRRGAEALSFLTMALVLRLLGGMTSVSSGTDAIFADMTNRSQNLGFLCDF
jgi:hypothetical protein